MSGEAASNRHEGRAPLTAGGLIGPYLLLAPLGGGGSGRVWAAARLGQLGFSKRTAIKVMRPEKLASASSQQRFVREARLGTELRHANIRAVYELNDEGGWPYMVMRWTETSLAELLAHAPGQRLLPELVCWFGAQCCWALAAMHDHVAPGHRSRFGGQPPGAAKPASPTVHRDVSPDNILLTAGGHVLLADLAAASNRGGGTHVTPPDTRFFGKPAYAAPEALRELPVDGRADLFSLGCVLYQALAGRRPFDAEYEHSVIYQILEGEPPELGKLAPDAPPELCSVVERALAKEARDRFQSADAMAQALSAIVATHSAFELEELAARQIEGVLGRQLRERERSLQAALERFAPARSEWADTLPIGGPRRGPDTASLTLSSPEAVKRLEPAPVLPPGFSAARAVPSERRRLLPAIALGTGVLGAAAIGGARLWSAATPAPITSETPAARAPTPPAPTAPAARAPRPEERPRAVAVEPSRDALSRPAITAPAVSNEARATAVLGLQPELTPAPRAPRSTPTKSRPAPALDTTSREQAPAKLLESETAAQAPEVTPTLTEPSPAEPTEPGVLSIDPNNPYALPQQR